MQKKRFNLNRNALRVSPNGAWVLRNRVVGIFAIDITRVHRMYKRMLSNDMIIDTTGKLPSKSLIILDTGQGIISPYTSNTIAATFDPKVNEEEGTDE